MPKVICTLPNASTLINGIAFEPHERGMVSCESLSPAVAAKLCSIQGYEAEKQSGSVNVPDIAALREKAEGLGIKVGAKWGADRISAEIEKAERAAQLKTSTSDPAPDPGAGKNPEGADGNKAPEGADGKAQEGSEGSGGEGNPDK